MESPCPWRPGGRRSPCWTQVGNGQLRSHDRLQARRARGIVKAGGAVDAVAIEERKRRVPEIGGAIHERFGQ